MKKILIGILLMVVLCVGFVVATTCYVQEHCPGDILCNGNTNTCIDCIDTDGYDPFTKGTLVQGTDGTIGYMIYYDDEEYCVNDDKVMEYHCVDESSSSVRYSSRITCSDLGDYSCYDGACVYNGLIGEVGAGVALVDDEIEQSFVEDSWGVSQLYLPLSMELNSNIVFSSCSDSDSDAADARYVPGTVRCRTNGRRFTSFEDSCTTLRAIDDNGDDMNQSAVLEYCVTEEKCEEISETGEIFETEILSGGYFITVYSTYSYCPDPSYYGCETDDGVGYCVVAHGVGQGDAAVAQIGSSQVNQGWYQALRNAITGGFFF